MLLSGRIGPRRWHLFRGKCTGKEMTKIYLADVLGGVAMEGVSAVDARGQIAWADGTLWRKPDSTDADVARLSRHAFLAKALCGVLVVGLAVVALGRWHHSQRVRPLAEKDHVQRQDSSHLDDME